MPSLVAAREIALTFDDCPRKAGPVLKPMERDQNLVSALEKANITAAFFCNSPTREPDGLQRLRYFADHGHRIANHSADHPDLNKMLVAEYVKNIDQGDLELRSLPNFRKWFRFPYLHEGKDAHDVEAVRRHLKQIGYTNGYVTVDTEDWYVDEVLRQKVMAGKKFDQDRLCQSYAKMMTEEAQFFDDMSVKALGRSVKHVILLHETDLNALCLENLIQKFKQENWSFISPDQAYHDPIATREPRASSKLNDGRVLALAKETKYTGPFSPKWSQPNEIENELERQNVWK